MVYALLFLPLGYVMGSIPFAHLIARARGVDIFQMGTANPGAANVFRTIGRGAGIVVLLGDAAKSALPVLVARWADAHPWLALAAGAAAIVGHWYPIFIGFRGGAGLAPAVGVAYGMIPMASLLATPPALISLYVRRNTGLAAAVGFILFFATAVLLGQSVSLALAIATLPALVLIRHFLLPAPRVPPSRGGDHIQSS